MATQTAELKAQVVDAWHKSKYFPQGLLETEHNFRVLGREISEASYVDISKIVEIVNRLTAAGRLQYDTPKIVEKIVERIVEVEKPKTAAQTAREKRAAADHAGVRTYGSDRTELDRETPRKLVEDETFNNNVRAANQLAARHNIDRLIQNYSVNSPSGRVDHGKTHLRREELRKIKITSDGEIDYIATVRAVAERIAKFER